MRLRNNNMEKKTFVSLRNTSFFAFINDTQQRVPKIWPFSRKQIIMRPVILLEEEKCLWMEKKGTVVQE